MKTHRQIGGRAGRMLAIALVSAAVASCGGGSSGSTTDDTPLPEQDLDNDGTPNGQDSDSDGDGIDDVTDTFVDWNQDGRDDLTNKTQAEIDAEANPQVEVSDEHPCGSDSTGRDNNSSTSTWADNCEVRRFSKNGEGQGQFADSGFSIGIQRVLFCKGFDEEEGQNNNTDYTAFADGEYGPSSEAAMQRFQTSEGLTVDGIVGPRTWARLQTHIELLTAGDPGTTPDVWGFTAGDCADIPMFYQTTSLNSAGDKVSGGWELAKNTPNTSERIPFAYFLRRP